MADIQQQVEKLQEQLEQHHEKQHHENRESHKHLTSDKDVKEGERPRNYDEEVSVRDEEVIVREEKEIKVRAAGAVAGTVIAAAQLTFDVLQAVLNALANINRKIAVGVGFQVGRGVWDQPTVYFFSGTMDDIIPYTVRDNEAPLLGFRKTSGPVATGTVGVFSYYNRSLNKTLLVLWSVPFDYNLYSNWWNVHLEDGRHTANNNWYNWLYYGSNGKPYPFRGDDNWKERNLGSNIRMRGAMNSSGTPRLQINLTL